MGAAMCCSISRAARLRLVYLDVLNRSPGKREARAVAA